MTMHDRDADRNDGKASAQEDRHQALTAGDAMSRALRRVAAALGDDGEPADEGDFWTAVDEAIKAGLAWREMVG